MQLKIVPLNLNFIINNWTTKRLFKCINILGDINRWNSNYLTINEKELRMHSYYIVLLLFRSTKSVYLQIYVDGNCLPTPTI